MGMRKENEDELLELMRQQEVRAIRKQEGAAELRKWAGGFGILAFWVFLAMLFLQPSESSVGADDRGYYVPFLWIIAILLGVAAVLWVASFFKEP